jgi:ATP-dependent Lon protease
MEMEITLPDEVPVMTLPNVTFFPQALMPLHIFEPRYRRMLKEVLATNRLFAVTGLDQNLLGQPGQFEPPHRIASVGIVRACQKNANGTSNLLLQGLCRVELLGIVSDEPYRRIKIRALPSAPVADPAENARLRTELARLIALKQKFGAPVPPEMAEFLRTVEDPEVFIDLAAFSLCDDTALKQKLLETLDVRRRLELFARQLRWDIEALRLRRKLQGGLPDERISDN